VVLVAPDGTRRYECVSSVPDDPATGPATAATAAPAAAVAE
jgi:hypothetical protein